MKNGQIGVTTDNIFPVIKKFLYSDQEIFLREMVSNAIDATQKLKTVSMSDEEVANYNEDDLKVFVSVDEEAGTIKISDRGIGMTEEEIDKYINQIAFSGVTDFIEKYKDNKNGIIGHFGLGFYSSFMVSERVEIITRSYKKGSKLLKWSCDGSPEFTIEELDDSVREGRGTDVILYLDADSKEEFGKKDKIKSLLNKYCKFLSVPVVFGKKTKWDPDQKKQVETEEDNLINPDEPLWRKHPTDLKDEDYKKFFRTLYPGQPEPLFWIHLNVSEPFELTGILFMPSLKDSVIVKKNTINLYCNNVFVTDEVNGIVPDFLQLLYGVIDSPDIPLNVSRSYLQSDKNVKKISGYIERKVSARLKTLFKDDRTKFEGLWDDMRLFINYGIVAEDDFYDRAKEFYLFKNTDGKYFTFDEYKTLIETNQKDKNDNLVYLYATNALEQASYVQTAKDKGYDVLLLDNQLDILAIETLERKFEKSSFKRVDSATIAKLIDKGDAETVTDNADDVALLRAMFQQNLKNQPNRYFNVTTEHMGEDVLPVMISQNEWSSRQKANRRFQSQIWGGNSENFTLTLNTDHELVKQVWNAAKKDLEKELKEANDKIAEAKKAVDDVNAELKDVKWEERTEEQNKKEQDAYDAQQKASEERDKICGEYAKDNVIVKELIEIALLSSNLLTGPQLADFIKRTVSLIDVESPKAKKRKKKTAKKVVEEVVTEELN